LRQAKTKHTGTAQPAHAIGGRKEKSSRQQRQKRRKHQRHKVTKK
jgi:hypothetical protein